MMANVAALKIGRLSRGTRIESLHFLSGALSTSNLFSTPCAELQDFCLRAVDSQFKFRLENELCNYLRKSTFELRNRANDGRKAGTKKSRAHARRGKQASLDRHKDTNTIKGEIQNKEVCCV